MDELDELNELDNLHQFVINEELKAMTLLNEHRRKRGTTENYKKKLGEKLNKYNCHGYTPLHCAAKYNRCKVLRRMINMRSEVDLNLPSKIENYTALHFLMNQKEENESGNIDSIVTDLMKARKSDNQDLCLYQKPWRQDSPDSPLHLACKNGNITMVKCLLKATQQKLSDEMKLSPPTPLHKAAESGSTDVVKNLLIVYTQKELFEVLTEKKCQSDKELSPLHIACRHGYIKIVNLLFDKIEGRNEKKKVAESLGRKNRTPLYYSCRSGNEEIIQLLIQYGATIKKDDDDGAFPIHVAARYGHCHIVECMKETINETDRHFNTALNIATRYDNIRMMRTLLDKGAKPSITNEELHTPLICAAIRGNYEAYCELQSKQASIYDTDGNGQNIVHIAASKGHSKFLKEILRQDQSDSDTQKNEKLVNSCDNKLNTPLHLAAKKGNIACVKELLQYDYINLEATNYKDRTPLHYAAAKGHYSILKCLLKKSCRFLAGDEKRNTALHLACKNGHYEATERLLRFQMGYNQRNNEERTALDVAAFEGHEKVVKLMISTIIPLEDLVNPVANHSPLHLAIEQGHVEVVKILLDRKVTNVCLPNCETGKTPLQDAMENEQESIAKVIIESGKNNMIMALKGKWIDSPRNPQTKETEARGKYPSIKIFNMLIEKMPLIAEMVLHKTTDLSASTAESNCQALKIEFGKDCGSTSESCEFLIAGERNPLNIMIELKRKKLIQNEHIRKLIKDMWKNHGFRYYFIGVIFKMLFMILLTRLFIITPTYHRPPNLASGPDHHVEAATTSIITLSPSGPAGTSEYRLDSLILLIMVFLLALYKLSDLCINGNYIKDWTNNVHNIAMLACTVIFLLSDAGKNAGPQYWQWQLGCMAVFLAWINLLMSLQMMWRGEYIIMFKKIFWSFLDTSLLTFILVMTFSTIFYIQFNAGQDLSKSSHFSFGWAILKVMTMMEGDLDFENLYNYFLRDKTDENNASEYPYFGISILLWILFLIIMPILLSNLLTGLAIGDVQDIQKKAALEKLKLIIKFALGVKKVQLKIKPLFNCIHKIVKYIPSCCLDNFQRISPDIDKTIDDIENSSDEKTELDKKMNSNLEQLMKKITVMESSLKECTQEVSHLKSLLEANNEITTR